MPPWPLLRAAETWRMEHSPASVQLRGDEMSSVIQSFGKTGREVGLQIQCQERKSVFSYNCRENQAGMTFENIVQEFKKLGTKLDLVLVILPFKGSKVYNEIKNLGDLKYKIPTQCCLKKVLFGKDGRPNGQVNHHRCHLLIFSSIANYYRLSPTSASRLTRSWRAQITCCRGTPGPRRSPSR